MNTKVLVSFLLTGFFVGLAFTYAGGGSEDGGEVDLGTVTMTDGVQVVEMQAKGGYSPSSVTLKAGVPTLIRMNSNGTYDCSAALQIPQINYSIFLPSSGVTEIEIPAQTPGTTIQGLCGMGMYGFKLNFE